MIAIVIPLLVTLGLVALGYFVGRGREGRHFENLKQRERALAHVTVVDVKSLPAMTAADMGRLVMGEAVVAADYWKSFAAGFRNLFGGEVKTYTTMLERGRREARLRMVEGADALGATLVVNARFETSSVGPALPSAEVFCYGTAVFVERS